MTWKTRKTDQQPPSIRRLLAVSFLALAVFLTACGSDSPTDAAAGDTDATATEAAAEAAADAAATAEAAADAAATAEAAAEATATAEAAADAAATAEAADAIATAEAVDAIATAEAVDAIATAEAADAIATAEAAATASSEWSESDWNTCVNSLTNGVENDRVRVAAMEVCAVLGPGYPDWQSSDDKGFEDLAITKCESAPDLFPRVTLGGDLLLRTHPMSRMHPVDLLDGSATKQDSYSPIRGLTKSESVDRIVVLDVPGHGDFIVDLITSMLSGDPPEIQLMDVSAGSLGRADSGDLGVGRFVRLSVVVAEIVAADANPGTIVNMSFGGYNCGEVPDALADAMVPLAQSGVRFVASAGNDEAGVDRIWPAALAERSDQIFSVGSMARPDSEGADSQRSCFSNFGPNAQHWVVGEEVFVGGVGSWSGTSFAAPQLAAFLATDESLDEYGVIDSVPDLQDADQVEVVVYDRTGEVIHTELVETFCSPSNPQYVPTTLIETN